MSDREDLLAREDTLPKILLQHARIQPENTAFREKDLGIWQSWGWRATSDQVRAFACGLAKQGLTRGDNVAIIGENRPHLYWAMAACQAVGAVPVPIYPDSGTDEVRRVLDHARVRLAVVEGQEQVDKVLAVRDSCPNLGHIIYVDSRGLRHYGQPYLTNFEDVVEHGRTFDAANPEFFLEAVAKGKGADLCVILYTAGATGHPKGVMLNFDNIIITARNANAQEHVNGKEELLAYLPMAWAGDHIVSYGQALVGGFTVNCPESADTVMLDLREIGPTSLFAPPRIFDTIRAQVTTRMAGAGWLKRKMFRHFMNVAKRSGTAILDRKPVPFRDRLAYEVGQILVYGPLKNTLGFSRVRRAYSTGEAIAPEVFNFYRSLGINLKQLYGQTEACVYVTVQPDNDVKPGTVGAPAPDCQVKIAETGEVLYRGPGTFMGYYRDAEATARVKTADGWMHTGDAGILGEDGQLEIIDRLSDIGRLTDGTRFAPKRIESGLKGSAFIKEAVTIGDRRDFVTALITINLGSLGGWAEEQGIAFTSYADLAARDEVYTLVAGHIERVNRELAAEPGLAPSQIKRFLILNKQFDAEDGELTQTGKVRRGMIHERYANLVDALYSEGGEVAAEDGPTVIKIRDVGAATEQLRKAS